jgi:8-oxo-dGTP pyrophosphatase MutT (NUDIX family)
MHTVKRRSYGIVPIAIGQDQSPIFLLLRAYRNWDFPKGGADVDETPLDAAKREMIEETGITQLDMQWGSISMDTEIYSTDKVASYFLARVEKQDISLPISEELGKPEHDEYRWVTFEEAQALLPQRLRLILAWAKNTALNSAIH